MIKSVDYFINSFMTCIMNNFVLDDGCSIHKKHAQILAEIRVSEVTSEEKEIYLQNIERAFKIIKQDLFGREGKNGN